MSGDRHERVGRRAYELWEQEGGGHGRHDDHWRRAAGEIDRQAAISAADGTTFAVPREEVEGEPPAGELDSAVRKHAGARARGTTATTPAAAKPRKSRAK